MTRQEIKTAIKIMEMPIVGDRTRACLLRDAFDNLKTAIRVLKLDNEKDLGIIVGCLISTMTAQTAYFLEMNIIERGKDNV